MHKLDSVLFHVKQGIKWLVRNRSSAKANKRPIDIVYCMVDHYEPGNGGVDVATEIARVDELIERFPALAERHRDSVGRTAKRTWFFPPHYHRFGNLSKLVGLCAEGHGEIELHLHHGKVAPDTAENLEATITQCIKEYSLYGIFGELRGIKRYGFIHGDSALDNSRNGLYCGVNNEIDVLRRTGCYADFTHPSGPETSPILLNTIFYATGRPGIAKGYASGVLSEVGRQGDGLLIVQGPAYPSRVRGAAGTFRIIGDHVPDRIPTDAKRVNNWVRAGVCVTGREDVIFVKTSTHGAAFPEASMGSETEAILSTLEASFNDGREYRLHYVTARELYNIVRAIEDAQYDGDHLDALFDYEVTRPRYVTSRCESEASETLKALVRKTYREM